MKHVLLLLLMLGLVTCSNEPDPTGGEDDDTNVEDDAGYRQYGPDEIDGMIAAIGRGTTRAGERALAALPADPNHFEEHPELLERVRSALLGILEGDIAEHNRSLAIGKLMAMGEHAGPVLPQLMERLEHPVDGPLIAAGLAKLGALGRTAIPRLIELLGAGASRANLYLIDGLARFGPDAAPAVPILASILKENANGIVRMKTAEALGSIGEAASSALPTLDELAASGGANLAAAAKAAAEKIRNDG